MPDPKKVGLTAVAAATLAATVVNWVPAWKSYMATGNPSDVVSSPTVAAAIGQKVDATSGQSLNQTIITPGITGGTDDGLTTVGNIGSTPLSLASLLGDRVNLLSYGATGGSADSSAAMTAAIAANAGTGGGVIVPYKSAGYTFSSGSFSAAALGLYDFRGNTITGAAIGDPTSGTGTLLSPYTNPYNITSNLKFELDPAALPQGNNVTVNGATIECAHNRANPLNANPNRNWVACLYRGMDSGTGGGSGTSINSEIDNDVLNLSSNAATDMEIDVNFNGVVKDGGVSRALFLTGGGATGNTTNSVALDIMHDAYDGSWLPWSTGISIRQATNMIQLHRTQALEAGFFFQALDQNNNAIAWIDKNGFQTGSGYTSSGNVTVSGKYCLDSACTRYVYESGSKVVIGNTINGNVASIDDSGNMTLKGTLTQSGTP